MSEQAYTRQSVIEAYQRLGNVRATCAETGVSPYVAVIWLTQAKVLKPSDSSRYGCASSRRGALAEQEFQRLVPQAISANRNVAEHTPGFDFMLGELTIDVKFTSPSPTDGKWRWRMPGNKALQPDFVVVFLSNDSETLAAGYRMLLLPVVLFPGQTGITLTPKRFHEHPLLEFEVQPDTLAGLLQGGVQ